jgi:hypothetical protein
MVTTNLGHISKVFIYQYGGENALVAILMQGFFLYAYYKYNNNYIVINHERRYPQNVKITGLVERL